MCHLWGSYIPPPSSYIPPLSSAALRSPSIVILCYSDDTQLYFKMDNMDSSPSQPSSLSTLTACLKETKVWMKHNFLHLNSTKTEAIQIGTPHQTRHSTLHSISVSGQDIPLSTSITNITVLVDRNFIHTWIMSVKLPFLTSKTCHNPTNTHPPWCHKVHPGFCLLQIRPQQCTTLHSKKWSVNISESAYFNLDRVFITIWRVNLL